MANNNRPGFDATQTAVYWSELDVYTVPLRPRSKRPKDHNWTQLRLVPKTIPKAFSIGDNIGALWGEPSNWIVDIDLDTEEACLVAPHILPETFIYGRRGKPNSHYLYRCIGAETKKWQIARSIGTVVEIRSTGAQSVLPPSIHPDGDRYQIYHDVEFHVISKMDLERHCDEIAVAGVFLHFYPEEGSRHDYVHVCTGTLMHSGWHEDKVKRVMAAVLTVAQEEDEELKDRLGAVVNTIEHHNLGDRTQGLKTLETWMDTQTLTQLRRWTQSGAKEGRLLTPPPLVLRSPSEMDFNEEWLKVPGMVGDIIKWSSKRSYIYQPSFDLATALMCTAVATTNNYIIDTWETPLQPYLMITAPTGDGKGAVLSAIQQFAREIDLDDIIYRGFQSYYSMLDELSEPPNMAVWLWDEAARHMASARSAASQDFQVLTHVTSLYGQANEYVPGTPGRKQAIPPLERPFLLILATAQPDQLMEALTSVAEETGFVNRFILFDSGIDFPVRNKNRSRIFPSKIKRQARALAKHEPTRGETTPVKFDTTKTWNMFDDFEETARRRSHRGEKVWARANQNALMIAGLGAVGVDSHKPLITNDLARWAIQIVTWSNDHWADKIRLTGGDSINEKESFRVQERIKNARKYEGTAQSLIHKGLLKKGFMPHSILLRLTRSIQRQRLETILDDLHDAELIGSNEMEDNMVYFMK